MRKNPRPATGGARLAARRRRAPPTPRAFTPSPPHPLTRSPQRGVTLLELLVALTIIVMVAGALGAITRATQLGFEYNQGHGDATQHARVALERITRTAREATANEAFPGFVVVAEQAGSWRFPDTLVVWHPQADPVSPEGLPRLNELVIYCPSPNDPGTLVEITTPSTAKLLADEAARAAQIEAIKHSDASTATPLTNLLRTAPVVDGNDAQLRGAVRFEVLLRPSKDDLDSYHEEAQKSGADTVELWKGLPWVQGIYGAETGLRQAWVRIELQVMTGRPPADGTADRRQAIPFFGSAAVYYTLQKD